MRESGAEDGDGSSSNMILDDKLLDDTSSPGEMSLEVGVNFGCSKTELFVD